MEQFKILSTSSKRNVETKGTKSKYWSTVDGKKALIKINRYEGEKDIRSWNVSEKIYSEISNFLNFSCVKTDFILTEENKFGIASYDFRLTDMENILSGDDLFFSVFNRYSRKVGKKKDKIAKEDYTYTNILMILMHYDKSGKLIINFNRMMVMDALLGECDRHFENWGLYSKNEDQYYLLPAYDNSTCLLHEFREEEILERIMKKESIEDYAKKSLCKISIDGKRVNHFAFIDYLLEFNTGEIRKRLIEDIKKVHLVTDNYIKELVYKIPDSLCSEKQKELIIEYIILRRDILLSKVVKI